RWDQSIAAYLGALKADASLKQVFYKLGRAYTERGNHAQAINWYRKAIAEDATKPMAFYYLGYAYKEKRHKKEAIEAFRSYLTLKTDAEDKKDIEDEIYDLEHD
ncbi:MAG TPA: tetratricopeptide repeat protein, partial [Myxococcaceae bacterium]|nr:tetratricopeptide repeat protein [Myxococcaceae bacterium]